MANVVAQFVAQYSATQYPTTGVLANGSVSISIPELLSIGLKNGTAADQINLIAAPSYTFVGTTPQTANIITLSDVLGATTVFARVRMVIFKLYNTTTDGVTLAIGNAGSNPWTGFLGATSVMTMQAPSAGNPNGAFFVFAAPNTTGFVCGASNKNVLMTPSANCSLDFLVFGSDT